MFLTKQLPSVVFIYNISVSMVCFPIYQGLEEIYLVRKKQTESKVTSQQDIRRGMILKGRLSMLLIEILAPVPFRL